MAADMGFANLFGQAGLLPVNVASTSSSPITAISTTSGASWFSTQLFYSPTFYNQTVGTTPAELSEFVTLWMQAYSNMQQDAPSNAFCQSISSALALATNLMHINATEMCDIYMQYNDGSWADFVTAMLNATSTAYGDPTFVSQPAGPANRVSPLSQTDLLIQMSLAPNAKCGSFISYLSPSSPTATKAAKDVYAVAVAAQHAVKAETTRFQLGVPDSDLPLTVSVHVASINYSLSDFEEFYLYPGTGGQVATTTPFPRRSRRGSLRDFMAPFGGEPTVAQVASASSAAVGAFSGSVPSLMSQAYSKIQYDIENSQSIPSGIKRIALAFLQAFVDQDVYGSPALENLAVDSRWPEPSCHRTDSRLVDGGYTDGPSLALNIGQYQTVDQGDLTATLKVLLTDTNNEDDSDLQFLSYFATDFNAGVAPGDFLWPGSPTSNTSNSTNSSSLGDILSELVPIRSTQIFQESLNEEAIEELTVLIPGTNLTYARIVATTIDNPTYGVVKGQTVEILLLKINSDIPTFILGTQSTQELTVPLADLSQTIAGSQDLLVAVQAFLDGSM
jgi:hypothetical protein